MLKHIQSLEANPWFKEFQSAMLPKVIALMKIINNGENKKYVEDIEQTLMALKMNPSIKKLINDLETLNSDPNFIKIFIPAMMKAMMNAEKAELDMFVTCLSEMETFMDTMTIPLDGQCPVWKKTGFARGQHLNIMKMMDQGYVQLI